MPMMRAPATDAPVVDMPDAGLAELPADGPGCLVIHDEYRGGRELRQLRLSGEIIAGKLVVRRRSGSLDRAARSPAARLSELRLMSAAAGANRAELAAWRDEAERAAAIASGQPEKVAR
jgi:hypothetical protein